MTEPARRPDELIIGELTDQLDRTRRLLLGNPEEVAIRAMERETGVSKVEARITADLADRAPLAYPERFLDAHRLVMRAMEVLDRDGSREPKVPSLGPLTPLVELAVEKVADFIVKSYASDVAGRLRKLYARREAQAPPEQPARRLLARARVETERVAPDYGSGGGLPLLVAGGAAIPALGAVAQYAGAINFRSVWVVLALVGLMFVLFGALSWVLLRGAGVARRRSRLIMRAPLAALWETVGHCGDPPEDDSTIYATIAIVMTAIAWFLLPALAAVTFFL